jgi:hypothetical protein
VLQAALLGFDSWSKEERQQNEAEGDEDGGADGAHPGLCNQSPRI